MSTILERLGRAIWGSESPEGCDPSSPALCLLVKCDRCGELVRTRVEKAYELEAEYELTNGQRDDDTEEPKPTGYTLHKEMLGVQCQNLIYVQMHFDCHHRGTTKAIQGGQLVEFTDCE
ncbi:MAG: hypothetical protein WCP21_06905 [Armatimonadota bacterium]